MGNDIEFRVAVLMLILSLKLLRFRYARSPLNVGTWRAMKARPLDTALIVPFAICWELAIAVYIVFPHWVGGFSMPLAPWVRWLGMGAGIAALALFACAHQAIGSNFTFGPSVREDHELVVRGPYRWVRHPLYSVVFVLGFAYCAVSANWLIGLLGVGGGIIVFGIRIPNEEAELLVKFGDRYRAYMTRTGALIPRLRPPESSVVFRKPGAR